MEKIIHVNLDVSSVALCVVISHPCEGSIDHPIAFSSRKLLMEEKNYTTKKDKDLL